MAILLSPVLNEQMFDANGDPLAGGKIWTYLAGTTTPVVTYKTSTGTAQTNPIILDSSGNYTTGTQLWLDSGKTYKFVVMDANNVTIRTIDNITAINDVNATPDEWVQYTSTAFSYLSATSFSVVGDQTGIFQINRRVKTTNTGGTVYSTISSVVYSAPNTIITLVNDSGVLDSGLSAVYYGINAPVNPSLPKISATYWQMATQRILGRNTTGTGSVEELTYAQVASLLYPLITPVRGAIDGLNMSTAGSSGTISISAGTATDSTNSVYLTLSSAISKTTATWAVGDTNGGKLSAAAIENNTWCYFFAIRRPDTGVVDVGFDISPTSPTLPTNYTQYRYIGAGLMNGAAQWTRFVQNGDYFTWYSPPLDIDTQTTGTAALSTLTVPRGRKVLARFNIYGSDGTAGSTGIYISDPDISDDAPSISAAPLSTLGGNGAVTEANTAYGECWTNTSAQVRRRGRNSTNYCRLATIGWVDSRGKDA